ncbi:hypothetical protein IJS18_01905 [Candidatus Saccharibacteria bacterium]|nr:hypothetical protein [Candidatus Saccharibacteria bacterium]
MDASCKEAKRPRKWLLSVIAAVIAVVSCSSILAPQSVYADPEGEEPTNIKEECISSGAAKSLGWIVCPVMLLLADGAEDIYSWLEGFLQFDTSLLDESKVGGQSSHNAWHVFQGFANIAFAVLFMIVIISQVSGIGINNYGIKKILPKLIVTAILVNLSYYICLILVDVSNIVGSSILNLLTSLGGDLPSYVAESSGLESAASTALTAVPIAVALIAGGVTIVLNPAILLALLVSIIGLVISLATLLVMLAAREAIIVVLVVISPIAFVCYMLPNTKKLFDRWVKIAEGMLLLYPICGLLIGGGNFVSKLLLQAGAGDKDFVTAFTALLVGIVPIFFIPSVVKKAFAAAGDIGAKIQTAGQRFRGGTEKTIRDSNMYKRAATRMNAGVDRSGNLDAMGKVRAKMAESKAGRFLGMDRAMAGNLAQARKDQNASDEAGATLIGALARTGITEAEALDPALGASFGKGQEGAYYGRMFLSAAQKGSETEMNAAVEAMRNSNMKPKDIAKLMRYAENNGMLKFNGNNDARAAWLRDMSKRYGSDFLSTDMELATWAKTGGSYGSSSMTSLGEYGDYAHMTSGAGMINYDDIKPEDIGKLSGDSLAGMAHSGLLDASMARSVLASNQNLSADKKIMLSAIAAGADVTSITAADFKKQAQDAMVAKYDPTTGVAVNVDASTGKFKIGGKDFDIATRDSWTASQPRAVNIVDVDSNGLVVPHPTGGSSSP